MLRAKLLQPVTRARPHDSRTALDMYETEMAAGKVLLVASALRSEAIP